MGEERSTNYSISPSLSFPLLHNLLNLLKTIGEIMGKVLVNGDGDRAGPTLPAEGEGEEVAVGFVLEGPSPVVDICVPSKDGNQEGKKGERREREEGKRGG